MSCKVAIVIQPNQLFFYYHLSPYPMIQLMQQSIFCICLFSKLYLSVCTCIFFNRMKDNSPTKVLHSKLYVLLHSEQVI